MNNEQLTIVNEVLTKSITFLSKIENLSNKVDKMEEVCKQLTLKWDTISEKIKLEEKLDEVIKCQISTNKMLNLQMQINKMNIKVEDLNAKMDKVKNFLEQQDSDDESDSSVEFVEGQQAKQEKIKQEDS